MLGRGLFRGLGLLVVDVVKFGVARFELSVIARYDVMCSCSRARVGVVW